MKKLVLFVVIFLLGALSYMGIQSLISSQKQTPETNTLPIATSTVSGEAPVAEDPIQPEPEEDTITLAPDGTQLDGPFVIFNEDQEATDATVRIIRSPSEVLLQFENFDETYAYTSHVYFADDLEAETYIDLSPARFNEGILVYGVPLDADLENYSYILIFDRQNEKTEFYAKIQ